MLSTERLGPPFTIIACVVSMISICGANSKEVEKLKYMHRNLVVRGLVASP
jgi:hypothetical protein